MQLLGRDIALPCRDSVFASLSRRCRERGFLIAIETVTTRGQLLQPSCCNKFGLGKGFLCRDRVSWSGVMIGPSFVATEVSLSRI